MSQFENFIIKREEMERWGEMNYEL